MTAFGQHHWYRRFYATRASDTAREAPSLGVRSVLQRCGGRPRPLGPRRFWPPMPLARPVGGHGTGLRLQGLHVGHRTVQDALLPHAEPEGQRSPKAQGFSVQGQLLVLLQRRGIGLHQRGNGGGLKGRTAPDPSLEAMPSSLQRFFTPPPPWSKQRQMTRN